MMDLSLFLGEAVWPLLLFCLGREVKDRTVDAHGASTMLSFGNRLS